MTGRTNSADAVLKPSGLGRSRFAPSAKSMRHREVMALWCVRVCGFVRGEEATCTARVLTHLEQLSHPTLRADPPSEQQVHSKVSLRRAVDAV